ncbi:MAG: hypothetical protein ACI814_004674, partial [Mariniblastus sp.]
TPKADSSINLFSKKNQMEQNPYQAPAVEIASVQTWNSTLAGSKRLHFLWPIAFAMNLPVPFLFGVAFMAWSSVWALVVIAFFMLLAGFPLCARYPKFGMRLVAGSFLTAASQVFPVLQFFAGLIAIQFVSLMGMAIGAPEPVGGAITTVIPNIVEIALLTLTTGLIVAAAAFVAGGLILMIFPSAANLINPGFEPDEADP